MKEYIKNLVWKSEPPYLATALSPTGKYYIMYEKEDNEYIATFDGYVHVNSRKTLHSFHDAKNWCQEDFNSEAMEYLIESSEPNTKEATIQLMDHLAPIVRLGYNKACHDMLEWAISGNDFSDVDTQAELKAMKNTRHEFTNFELLEALKSQNNEA